MTAALAPLPTNTVAADLVLVRMALSGKTSPPPSKVREGVGKLLGTPLTPAEFDDLRRTLAADGFLGQGKRNAFSVTPDGRERAARFLGLDELPPRLRWDQAVARHLFPKLAGVPAKKAAELRSGDQLAAFILKRKFGFTSTQARALRLKLIHERLGTAPTPQPAGVPAVSEEPFDLTAFANTVLKLARVSPPADRFHDNKVFIAPLWRASQREPNFPRLALAEFKKRLVEANRQHLLHLSRADLVEFMDPQLVADSETNYLTATFHFVRLEGDRP